MSAQCKVQTDVWSARHGGRTPARTCRTQDEEQCMRRRGVWYSKRATGEQAGGRHGEPRTQVYCARQPQAYRFRDEVSEWRCGKARVLAKLVWRRAYWRHRAGDEVRDPEHGACWHRGCGGFMSGRHAAAGAGTAVDAVCGGGGVCMRAQREGGEAQPQPQQAYMHRRVYSAAGAVHGGRAGSGVPNAGGVAAVDAQRVHDEWWMHAGGFGWHGVDVASAGVRGEHEHSGLQTQMRQRQESLRREARDSGAAGTGHRLSQKAVGTGISGAAGVCGGEWRRSRSEAAGSHQGLGTPRSSSAGAASTHWQRAQRAGGGRGRKGASHV
ncbi:hypothetical protein DFH08DRAFT_805013 [Mycena albidolilacea]|uniref:Uncharacterized protein n=1 Tax=Mycena albidolilacea TaxID=1033008 RepID=A0AAD7AAH9_9AGAR|nr:hypothetical protein DFH08DRAFT_805013 [Mycena albidolilacea]